MKKLAEKIFLELIKIAETDINYTKSVKDRSIKAGFSFNEYIAAMAWACAISFKKVEEKISSREKLINEEK